MRADVIFNESLPYFRVVSTSRDLVPTRVPFVSPSPNPPVKFLIMYYFSVALYTLYPLIFLVVSVMSMLSTMDLTSSIVERLNVFFLVTLALKTQKRVQVLFSCS